MKKPSKPAAEQSSSERKRFSLPTAQVKLARLHGSFIEAISKGLNKDMVAERENLVSRGAAEKQQQQQKLDASLSEVSKRTISRASRGRKSIGSFMPSRELTKEKIELILPIIENYKQTKDAYSFKSTSSDDDTRSSFAPLAHNGQNDDAAHVNGFGSIEEGEEAAASTLVRRRGRPSLSEKRSKTPVGSALSDVSNTDADSQSSSKMSRKKTDDVAKALSRSTTSLASKTPESKSKAAINRRKSIGAIPMQGVKTSPLIKTRATRRSLAPGEAKTVTIKPEPTELSTGRQSKRATQTEAPAVALRPRRSLPRKSDTGKVDKASEDEAQEEEDEEAVVTPKSPKTKKTKRAAKQEESGDESDSGDESSDEIELEYKFLQKSNVLLKKALVCSLCEMCDSSVKECDGPCQRAFHPDCLGVLELDVASIKCSDCRAASQPCFMCKRPALDATDPVRKCSFSSCGYFYHESCIKAREGLFRREQVGQKTTFTCPLHTCKSCWIEAIQSTQSRNKSMIEENDDEAAKASSGLNSNALTQKAQKGKLVKCIRCPTAYHANETCLAAGTVVLGGSNILCPNHFKPNKKEPNHRLINVQWCFACCHMGELIGCNKCPAAYHYECIENASPELLDAFKDYLRNYKLTKERKAAAVQQAVKQEPSEASNSRQNSPSASSVISNTNTNVTTASNSTSTTLDHFNWTCEDCLNDRRPCYGDIVWSKVGAYRWWPGQIVHPRNLPERLREKWHQVGEFPVKFFGTHDHFWVTLNRCISFAQDDDCQRVGGYSGLGEAYIKGVRQAKLAYTRLQDLKRSLFEVDKSKRGGALKTAKYTFQYIRTNRPYGNVVVHRMPVADYPHCECDPKSANPCSTDDCVNRALKYECHPARCPAGDRCQNQRFVKRQYPKQEPLHTVDRGVGLISKVDIKKGEFVNEYVGELIDDEECRRRLREANENNVTNFYFLTIDKDRIIDAGPKGNLARFMNHSCEPNVETQKWMVNGDVRVGLFAVTDIAAGTELTFNYNLDCLSNEKAVCRCGAKNCSGFIGDRPKNGSSSNEQSSGAGGGSNPRKRKLSEVQSTVNKSKKTANGANATSTARRKSMSAVTLKAGSK